MNHDEFEKRAKKKKCNWIIIIGLSVLLAVVIGVVVLIWLNGEDGTTIVDVNPGENGSGTTKMNRSGSV